MDPIVDVWVGRLAFGLLFKKDFTLKTFASIAASTLLRRHGFFFGVWFFVFSALTLSIRGGFLHIFNHENMASFGHNQLVGPVYRLHLLLYICTSSKQCSASVSAIFGGADSMVNSLQAFNIALCMNFVVQKFYPP